MKPTARYLFTLGATVGLATAITGCSGGPASLGGRAPLTPTSRYSLEVEPGLDRIALAVHDAGLSSTQLSAVGELVGRFSRSGAKDVVVEVPSGGDQAAGALGWSLRTVMMNAGIPHDRIRITSYAAPSPRAPVLAGFETVQAVVHQCGQTWGSLTRSGDNQSSSNFGCATSANLAAQIANPRDLISPRDLTTANSARRSVVIEAFVGGKSTSSKPEPLLTSSRISQAVE